MIPSHFSFGSTLAMGFLAAMTASALLLLLLLPAAADETSCWEIDGSASLMTAMAAYSGAACAVDVTFPLVAASYAPNQSVPLLWAVQLDTDSPNAMDVPVPPDAMTTLSTDHAGEPVQILSTYVRTCTSRLQCTPSILGVDTFTTAQSGNFSSSDATYFESLDELSYAKEGNYTVAAVAILGNAANSTLLYYFQTFADIVVKDVQVEAQDYDSDETYCRVTAQNSLEASLDANVLLASSSSSEVELDVEAVNVVQAQQPVDIAWTATLTRNASKDIQLPTPLKAVFVLDDDSTNESGYYTIVSSVVKLCERSKACTEYSGAVDVSSADFSANFSSAGTATFNASGIIIPSTGWYSGFAQVTLAGNDADSQRYDFIQYFEMFATEENVAEQVETETYANDGSESYCWAVVAAAEDENVDATSVAYSGNGTNCPYTVNMTVSTTTFTVDAGALVSWTVAKQPAFTGTDGVLVNMTTVYDDSTGQYVNLPQVNIYYCDDTRCSPFSENKTLAYSAAAMNFSDRSGEALFSTKISIGNEGTYALMAHVVVPNGDDLRFDVASFMRMTVTASSKSASTDGSSSSHVGLILGLTLGCAAVVSLAVFGFAVMRRRRVQQEAEQQKERRYSFFGFRPLSNTNELPTNSPSGHGSDESGNFMYMKAQPSPPMDMRPRSSSLSYDPYARRSFLEAGDDASGYSFSLSDAEAPFPPSSPNERTTSTQLTLATHPF
ncbi:cGMP-dependent 3' [Phytophthora cinnamomi]|uniref:cGMP-dependent 3' n=1 Tax=Phytophthora cinnamomi TaxID=4785 RepID=UPI00355A4072|nr:cGMP-dependent 3' [Phytophthora cinnamomi]